MISTAKWRLAAFIFAVTAGAVAQLASDPVVAYTVANNFTLVSRSGSVLETVPLKPVFDFAISKDATKLIAVLPATSYGGPLELINLRTKQQSQLTHSPFYFKHLERGQTEVYADPEFSPDQHEVAFAVHLNSAGDSNDVVDASGPIAVINLDSRAIRVLTATADIDGQGACFANTPLWSPDGSRILFSCEAGAAITDTHGTGLQQLGIGTDQKPWAAAIGWVGDKCILYVQATDEEKFDSYEPRLLDLVTLKSQDAAPMLRDAVPNVAVAGLIEASDGAVIRRTTKLHIETAAKQQTLPTDAHAHLLGGWPSITVPAACR